MNLPEHDLGAVLSFPDGSSQRLCLAISQPVPRAISLASEKENVDPSIFLLADEIGWHLGAPRLSPRRYA
jgi:hypothetical protein